MRLPWPEYRCSALLFLYHRVKRCVMDEYDELLDGGGGGVGGGDDDGFLGGDVLGFPSRCGRRSRGSAWNAGCTHTHLSVDRSLFPPFVG